MLEGGWGGVPVKTGMLRVLLLLGALAPRAAPAQAEAPERSPIVPVVVTEKYQVNAQYADPSVKKNISKIGEGTVTYTTRGPGKFGLKLLGRVQSPRDGKVYDFDVDIDYSASGNNVSQVANRSRYTAAVQEFRSRIESVVPFVYLAKYRKPGDHGSEQAFRFRGSEYMVRTAHTEQQVEVALYEEQTLIGKFFIPRGHKGEQVFDKFRLPTEGKISLTFVRL